MFLIDFLSEFIQVTIFQYMFGAFAFYGLFLCIKKVIHK